MTFLPFVLLLFLLCVSLHACTPRPVTKKDTAKHHFDKVGFQIPIVFPFVLCYKHRLCEAFELLIERKICDYLQELDNVKLLGTLTTSSVKDHTLEENPAQQQKVTNNEINICGSCSSASTLKGVIVGAASGA